MIEGVRLKDQRWCLESRMLEIENMRLQILVMTGLEQDPPTGIRYKPHHGILSFLDTLKVKIKR